MDIIKITIKYSGEIILNNEYTAHGPLEMDWFPGNDLTAEANGKKVTISTNQTEAGKNYTLPASVFG